jgi:transcriptional regulator with XRE-family HTH domain
VIKIKNKAYVEAFGKHLAKLRKERKLSQEALAIEADIPLSQIGRIERGEINTTISTVYALAQALSIHPKDLLDFKIKK